MINIERLRWTISILIPQFAPKYLFKKGFRLWREQISIDKHLCERTLISCGLGFTFFYLSSGTRHISDLILEPYTIVKVITYEIINEQERSVSYYYSVSVLKVISILQFLFH